MLNDFVTLVGAGLVALVLVVRVRAKRSDRRRDEDEARGRPPR